MTQPLPGADHGDSDERAWCERARRALGEAVYERSIGYAEPAPRAAGGQLLLGDTALQLEHAARLVFVDLAPGVNWGHSACWLLLAAEGGAVRRVDVRMPPFLKADGPTVRPLWRGKDAPAWAVHGG